MSMVKSGMDDLGGATGALRSVVEKWLGASGAADMQITGGGGTGRYPGRYVRIESPCRNDGAAMSTHLFAA
ncbi:hypothetical protein [Burkholderia sp. IDO3]|uniref:hypothetical protein n=1 Tax=Burkholderia sp. IDO3 TaxID=1705310 RepID=UPI00117801E7|nr:hypothetical protein [Burkholderia sp. IDO3]